MENLEQQTDNTPTFKAPPVKGWGIDADRENDPTYPIKEHTRTEHDGYSWDRPPQQQPEMEVLHSTERPNLAATFGETIPPAGLSGMIRRAAFKNDEDSYSHWVPLILADRVQMVECLVTDLATGHVPNLWKELGYGAEWKYNKKGLITKLAIFGGIAVGVGFLLTRRSGDSSSEA